MTSAQLRAWPLIGRDVEIGVCRETIAAGRGVIISGPAGVGKTRLARELADELEAERAVLRLAPTALSIPLSALAAAGGSGSTPIVVLDDAQHLDDDAAALVHRLVMQREIVLVATLRSGEEVPGAVTSLWKDEHVERVDLTEFDREQVDKLLDDVLTGPIAASSRRTFWDTTRGSPLMLRELMRSALADQTLVEVDGLWRLTHPPRSIRLDELVAERLDALDDHVRLVVELVSLGEPVGFGALIAAVGTPALAAAEESGLIEAVTDGLRREVRVSHPVFGDVARRTMTEARTVEHCRELLAFIEATPLRRRDDIVRAVAWQLRVGGTVMSGDMVLAARRALYDQQEQLAIDLATRALAGSEIEAALVLGVAFADRGDHEQADRVLRGVDATVTERERSLVAIQRADAMFWGLGRADETQELLRAAEHDLTAGPWRDAVAATRAVMLSNAGRPQDALELAEPLIGGEPHGRAFVTASVAATVGLALTGRGNDARDLAAVAYAACDALGEQLAVPDRGLFIILGTTAAHELGALVESEETARMVHDFTVANGDRAGQAWGALTLGRALLTQGKLTEASARLAESAGAFASIHQLGPRRWALAGVTMCAVLSGDSAGAEATWSEMLSVLDHPGEMMGSEVERAEAWMAESRGDRTEAIRLLHRAAERATEKGAIVLAGSALHDIIRIGGSVEPDSWTDLARCQGQLPALRVAFADATLNRSAVDALACAQGFADIGADLFAAEAAMTAAELHESNGDLRAATRARLVASDAQNRTGEDWFHTLDRSTAAPAAFMTERELAIATRAADGRTSRMIAEELDISVRTVDNHLQRVYDKLGVRGRRELKPALAIL